MGKRRKSRSAFDDGADSETYNEAGSSSSPSLYEILGVENSSSKQEIKKAYHKLALKLHPDKNPNDEEAKEKFQQLQKVMSILGDEEKRKLYDETGCADDVDLASETMQNLKEFFKSMYKRVTEEDIEEFEANYRGSVSESSDLIKLYKQYNGNMNKLFCSMLCSDPVVDSHRFKDIIDAAVSSGEVKENKVYKKWATRVSKMDAPTSPQKKRISKREKSDLLKMMEQRVSRRKENFDMFFSTLVSKYGGTAAPEPSDAEFEAARKKIDSRRAAKKAKGLRPDTRFTCCPPLAWLGHTTCFLCMVLRPKSFSQPSPTSAQPMTKSIIRPNAGSDPSPSLGRPPACGKVNLG